MTGPALKHLTYRPGTILADRYHILDVAGSGAIGTVLRARDAELDREMVALKVLHLHLVSDKQALARFQNEVLITRQLSHPNIVRLYDFAGVEEQMLYFLAMEYIQGPNLKDFLSIHHGRRLAFDDAVRVLHQLALALSFAHEKGIVHRDIKPENILLNLNGEIKLSDFGLAHALNSSIGLTATGEVLGSPAYMAPEAFRGEKLCPLADIYSLGVLAYEIAAGALPFRQENMVALAQSHLQGAIPEAPLQEAGIPAWYAKLVHRCMAKNKTERYTSCSELLDHLRSASAETLLNPQITLTTMSRIKLPRKRLLPQRLEQFIRFFFWLGLIAILYGVIHPGNTNGREYLLASIFKLEKEFSLSLDPIKKTLGYHRWSIRDPDLAAKIIKAEDHVALIALLTLDPDLSHVDDDGNSLVHLAMHKREPAFVHTLVTNKAPVNLANKMGETPIIYAVKNSLTYVIHILLRFGASPNLADREGNTALHWAALYKNHDIIDKIMKWSKEPVLFPKHNRDGNTALHIAAAHCDLRSMHYLLLGGADPNVADSSGQTPLVHLLRSSAEQIYLCAELLLRQGADLQARDHQCLSVLDHARASGQDSMVMAIAQHLSQADSPAALPDRP